MTVATDDTRLPSLFAHTTRKDWGVGVLAWEAGGKRGYLFEDGEERTMASGFHELMRKVEQPSADQKAASLRLRSVLAARAIALSSNPGAGGPNFLDQLARFREVYAEGLSDPKWVEDIRGEGAEQPAPRHRAALIQKAQEQLSATALDSLISGQRYEQLWDLVIGVLARTDLVPTAQLKKPKSPNTEQLRDLAVAVRELIYGKAAYEQRFDRFVAALAAYSGEPARWEITTALPALVHPAEHVCVHPTVFRLQLKALGSRGTAAARPSGTGYTRLLVVTRAVAKKLTDQGEQPRDLMDVHDFIRATLKPATKARVTAKASRSVAPAAAPAEVDAEEEDESDEG